MASLLVYLDGSRLDELLPESVPGDTWLVGADTFSYPQLERLDEQSWLFIVSGTRCVAVLRNPRMENGVFMGGTALVYNRDISHILPRLGCPEVEASEFTSGAGDDGRVAEWAAIPRVVPPSDLDLLRYELGIADEEDVDPVQPDDERTRELRAAVWDDPISDDARLVYADYLQDRGDPRGELVALQVTRARSAEPASDREKLLVRRIAPDCAQPLTPYLVRGFELARGFLAKCTVSDTPMPDAIRWHQAWRTVEDLSTTNYHLLVSPHVHAKRVGLGAGQLALLVEHVRPLPFETVVGIAPLGESQHGVWITEAAWDSVTSVGALTEVHTLSVNPEMSSLGPRMIPAVLRSPLGQRLRQLDAFIALQPADAPRWREAFDLARTALLTLRFIPVTPGRRMWIGPEVLVGLRRSARLPHLIVQVDDLLGTEHVTALMRFVAQLSRNIQTAELHDFGARRGERIETRNAALVERMNAMFPQMTVQPAGARPLAP